MNPYLRGALFCFAIAAAVAGTMLYGCVQHYEKVGWCRHVATYDATVYGDYCPTRVVVGSHNGSYHCQAQAFDGKEWRWLCSDNGVVRYCPEDKAFVPREFYKTRVWLMIMGRWVKE